MMSKRQLAQAGVLRALVLVASDVELLAGAEAMVTFGPAVLHSMAANFSRSPRVVSAIAFGKN
jgi:hypothetical protein